MSEGPDRRGLWRGADGRLRSGWRLVLWLGAATLAGVAVELVLPPGALTARAGGLAAVLLAVSLLAWRWLDRRSPAETPLAAGPTAATRFSAGFGLGLAVALGVVAVLALAGAITFETRACELGQAGTRLLETLLLFLLAATAEELLLRGYGLFALRDGMGGIAAVAITSLLFSLLHAGNPHYGAAAAANIAIVGAVLGAWVLWTGTVWGAVGLHAGWNWALGAAAALPVSGLPFPAPCHVGRLEGAGWATGGAFGLEASVVTTLAWVALGVLLWRRAARGG